MQFSITVDNRNYVDIKIGKSHIEVWHQNLSYVGSTDIDNIVFPKRKDTTKVLDFIFSTNDATVIANIIAEMPKSTNETTWWSQNGKHNSSHLPAHASYS